MIFMKNVKSSKKILNLKYILTLFLLLFLNSCQKNVDKSENEKFEPNAYERAKEFAEKNPVTIFGGNKSKGTNFEFASSNVLWRATLKSLEFLPLINADYTGGIIIYDWYSDDNKPSEQIKISVQFLSNELRSDSIKITAHKKQCDNSNKCTNLILDKKFSDSIKEKIILTARSIKIDEIKSEKK